MRLPEVPSVIQYILTVEDVDIFFDIKTYTFKTAWRDYLRNVIGEKNRYCVLKLAIIMLKR